ncbi:unnamed protein product [Rotaria socialis]|uniref:Metallo-beta-lactamase domain-containing protein n=1 Tax=Rotaria socialis TaxID=392032 RepID=A0A818L8A7_9BILA|nr:unnamed protein product [Rotaria socialis]CAF3684547.1 unnamed protein product [Rotaria socialis]
MDDERIEHPSWLNTRLIEPGFYLTTEDYYYSVPPTKCEPIIDDHQINLGGDDDDVIEIKHVPGHTPGSIVCYYSRKNALFSGDFVYECGSGRCLFHWAPTSPSKDYVQSAKQMIDWFAQHEIMNVNQVRKPLNKYIEYEE